MADPIRKIIHIDMDAFFASVEQRDNPAFAGKPLAVGGEGERSVVAAASYEARRFGVRSAMPGALARRLCPALVFTRPRFDVYRAVSAEIRSIFLEYTPLVEPMSLDEAYLDVTENLRGMELARDVAREVRARIRERTGLTASAGVSYCKFLAKMASDQRKPDGMFVIPPDRGKAFVAALPIGKFHGIGPATAEKMLALGIRQGRDLEDRGEVFLVEHFGKAGRYFHRLSLGIDDRPVQPERPRKSASAETTFEYDIHDPAVVVEKTAEMAARAWERATRHGTSGRSVSLKIRFEDFEDLSRSRTFPHPFADAGGFAAAASGLLETLLPFDRGIRLIGVTMSGFADEAPEEESPQLDLFGDSSGAL